MKELEIWFQKNDPIMNNEKRVAILFHSDRFIDFPANHQWFLMAMKQLSNQKSGFLGIYITENLKWNVHVCSLCSSLSRSSL